MYRGKIRAAEGGDQPPQPEALCSVRPWVLCPWADGSSTGSGCRAGRARPHAPQREEQRGSCRAASKGGSLRGEHGDGVMVWGLAKPLPRCVHGLSSLLPSPPALKGCDAGEPTPVDAELQAGARFAAAELTALRCQQESTRALCWGTV